MHVVEAGDKVVVMTGENLLVSRIMLTVSINQLSGMGSRVGSSKERGDAVGVGLHPKIVWIK